MDESGEAIGESNETDIDHKNSPTLYKHLSLTHSSPVIYSTFKVVRNDIKSNTLDFIAAIKSRKKSFLSFAYKKDVRGREGELNAHAQIDFKQAEKAQSRDWDQLSLDELRIGASPSHSLARQPRSRQASLQELGSNSISNSAQQLNCIVEMPPVMQDDRDNNSGILEELPPKVPPKDTPSEEPLKDTTSKKGSKCLSTKVSEDALSSLNVNFKDMFAFAQGDFKLPSPNDNPHPDASIPQSLIFSDPINSKANSKLGNAYPSTINNIKTSGLDSTSNLDIFKPTNLSPIRMSPPKYFTLDTRTGDNVDETQYMKNMLPPLNHLTLDSINYSHNNKILRCPASPKISPPHFTPLEYHDTLASNLIDMKKKAIVSCTEPEALDTSATAASLTLSKRRSKRRSQYFESYFATVPFVDKLTDSAADELKNHETLVRLVDDVSTAIPEESIQHIAHVDINLADIATGYTPKENNIFEIDASNLGSPYESGIYPADGCLPLNLDFKGVDKSKVSYLVENTFIDNLTARISDDELSILSAPLIPLSTQTNSFAQENYLPSQTNDLDQVSQSTTEPSKSNTKPQIVWVPNPAPKKPWSWISNLLHKQKIKPSRLIELDYPVEILPTSRLSPDEEKFVYARSHEKLAQMDRSLIQQVEISNLMMYILSVHSAVTLKGRGPQRKRRKARRRKRYVPLVVAAKKFEVRVKGDLDSSSDDSDEGDEETDLSSRISRQGPASTANEDDEDDIPLAMLQKK